MISVCAEPAVVGSARDEPAISVSSSSREVDEREVLPGKEEPDLIPGKGREAPRNKVKPDAAIDRTGHSPCP